jgi:hypothetical protein
MAGQLGVLIGWWKTMVTLGNSESAAVWQTFRFSSIFSLLEYELWLPMTLRLVKALASQMPRWRQ